MMKTCTQVKQPNGKVKTVTAYTYNSHIMYALEKDD